MNQVATPLTLGGKTILFQFVTGINSAMRYKTEEFMLSDKFGVKKSVALERKDLKSFFFLPDSSGYEQEIVLHNRDYIQLEPGQKITMLQARVPSRLAKWLRADEDSWGYVNVLLIDHSKGMHFHLADLTNTRLINFGLEDYFSLVAFLIVLLGAVSIGYSVSSMLGNTFFGIGIGIVAFAFLLLPFSFINKALEFMLKPFKVYRAEKIERHTSKLAREFLQQMPESQL